MKAADIDDGDMVAAVAHIQEVKGSWANVGEVEAHFPDFPPKVVVAKLARLIKRGLLTGCTCGCRGDFEVTEKGGGLL